MRDSLKSGKIFVTSSFPKHIGGLNTHFELLCAGLIKFGFSTSFFRSMPDKLSYARKLRLYIQSGFSKDRARLQLFKERMDLFSTQVREEISRNEPVRLVHCHDIFAVYALRDIQKPIVLTVHGPTSRELKMIGWRDKKALAAVQWIEKTAYDRAEMIIAVDTGQKEILVEDFGIPQSKIIVIFNAVDTDEVKLLSLRESLEFRFDHPFVLVPRRLVPKNGVSITIKAMKFLQNKNCTLVIAGDGPEKSKLLKLCKTQELTERVVFLEALPREKLLPLMAQAQVLVIPSLPIHGVIEATSLSVLEAMSLGKVVIASRIGGLNEIISHVENGFLFDAGDEKMLAELLSKILSDRDLQELIGQKAL